MPETWERLETETARAYECFCVYRDMPTDSRSLAAAYREETGKKQARQASGVWKDWNTQFNWVERATAYDDYRREIERQEIEAERKRAREERRKLVRAAKSSLSIALTTFNKQLQTGQALTSNEIVNLMKMVLQEERAEYNDLPTQRQESLNFDLSKATDEQLQRIADGEHPATVMADSSGG